jgi:hypothetical protein
MIVESVNLPELTHAATDWDRRLYRALWDQFRVHVERLTAIEGTIGLTIRKLGWIKRGITTQTAATYTVLNSDYHMIANRAGTITYTLPAASTNLGRELVIRTITANTVVSAASDVVPLAGGAAGTAILAATAGKWALAVSDGTAWQIMEGN